MKKKLKIMGWITLFYLCVIFFPITISYWIFTGIDLLDVCVDKADKLK